MAERFDKFTEPAREALGRARDEAVRLQHDSIGTEHLLLGLLGDRGGTAARVLADLGVDPDHLRSQTERLAGRGTRSAFADLGFTPGAKKVFECAVDELRRLNHAEIGTGHLLLGLLREGRGIAAEALASFGVDVEAARTRVASAAPETPAQTAAPEVASRPEPTRGAARAPDGFRRFTAEAREALAHAEEEARRRRLGYIGAEHMLLGLLREQEGLAAKSLREVGVDYQWASDFVDTVVGPGDRSTAADIGLTARAKRALELAVQEARLRGHLYIGVEHLLLGLLAEGGGIVAGMLDHLGVSFQAAWSTVERQMELREEGRE